MAAGIPCVASRVCGIPEAVTDASGVLDYRRRAHKDKINIPYAIPGDRKSVV